MGPCVYLDYPKWNVSDQHPAARARLPHVLKLQIHTPNKSENPGGNEPNAPDGETSAPEVFKYRNGL
jgi:hypothetical protein